MATKPTTTKTTKTKTPKSTKSPASKATTHKKVATTLTSVLDHPTMQVIQDRTQDVIPTARILVESWRMDLYNRSPGPSLNMNGEFVGTDLDLATLLYSLEVRKAVINLPKYTAMRARTQTAGTRVVAATNRHGNIIGLVSNQAVFSFGVQVNDQNVVITDPSTGAETTGAPRNFTIVNVLSRWHDGWKTIEFAPSAKENDFLKDHKIWVGSTIPVKYFVHPNRWVSFYGQPYFLTKAMIQRLEEESTFLNSEIKRLQAEKIPYPPSAKTAPKEWPKTVKVGQERKVKVQAFEVEVDLPDNNTVFPKTPSTSAALAEISDRRREIQYHLLPRLRFATRAVEFAYYRYGFDPDTEKTHGYWKEKFPAWITNANWERGYREAGKRTDWNRLCLHQAKVGERAIAIRYRAWLKTETLAAE